MTAKINENTRVHILDLLIDINDLEESDELTSIIRLIELGMLRGFTKE